VRTWYDAVIHTSSFANASSIIPCAVGYVVPLTFASAGSILRSAANAFAARGLYNGCTRTPRKPFTACLPRRGRRPSPPALHSRDLLRTM
jgi:hypothetical protein